jgi:hypothetical protein
MDDITENAELYLLSMADNMAAAASAFNAHGYDTFIQARDEFKEKLHEIISSQQQSN